MRIASKRAGLRKLTDDETKHAVGGANPIVVRVVANVLIAAGKDAYENPIDVGGLLEAGKQRLSRAR
jgi:hypothetical protein